MFVFCVRSHLVNKLWESWWEEDRNTAHFFVYNSGYRTYKNINISLAAPQFIYSGIVLHVLGEQTETSSLQTHSIPYKFNPSLSVSHLFFLVIEVVFCCCCCGCKKYIVIWKNEIYLVSLWNCCAFVGNSFKLNEILCVYIEYTNATVWETAVLL